MPLSTGQRLGPYEILSPAGAGGMGEVYRAKDTRLDRIVAIKVLPAHVASDLDLRQRFEREARAVSSLNHPHICALYDVGHRDGTDFLVLEYLEGETLAQRLRKGPLPLDQLLKTGIEIASALDAAHRKGIVHRDLKPGNVMLVKAGAKVLDFGLAKVVMPVSGVSSLTAAPTLTSPLTGEGAILGTLPYLAPEQLEGKKADARTDLFAFGTVLYEMVTGCKAFEGKSRASLIAAILASDPRPLSELEPTTPPALDRLVRKCLAKDPDERWQTARDLADEVKWIAQTGSLTSTTSPVETRRRGREWLAWLVTGLSITLATVVAVTYRHRTPPPARPIRAVVNPPEETAFNLTGDFGAPPVISPDGGTLVFGAGGKLWARSLMEVTARPLPGTENARFPFWSPDSRSIGFFADGKLKTIDAFGGAPLTLCSADDPRGGAWSRDGVIVFTPNIRIGIYRVPASGGTPSPVTTLDTSKHSTHRWPIFLPDGRHFLYLALSHAIPMSEESAIYVADLDGGQSRLVMRSHSNVVYVSGHLLFLRGNSLMAQPFNLERLALEGEAVRIAGEVFYDASVWRGMFTASENALLAYLPETEVPGSQLTWFDRSGKVLGTVGERRNYVAPHLSPDGHKLAVLILDTSANVWVYDLDHGARTRLTFSSTVSGGAIWSPDGSRIAFSSARQNNRIAIYEKASSGAGSERILQQAEVLQNPTDWSPDGRWIVYDRSEMGSTGIGILPVNGEQKSHSLVPARPRAWGGHFSPDGRWIAYCSEESGTNEVYIVPFPGPGGKWQVSAGGGLSPHWRRDGHEIFFPSLDDTTLMAAEVKAHGTDIEVGTPRPLFRVSASSGPWGTVSGYDVSPDGRRFLVNVGEPLKTAPLTLVTDWMAELKK